MEVEESSSAVVAEADSRGDGDGAGDAADQPPPAPDPPLNAAAADNDADELPADPSPQPTAAAAAAAADVWEAPAAEQRGMEEEEEEAKAASGRVAEVPPACTLVEMLEAQELTGLMTNVANAQLLAAYLASGDAAGARLLWQRLSTAAKKDAQTAAVWLVGRQICARETVGAYHAIEQTNWSDDLKPVMDALLTKTRADAWALVGRAYSAIRLDDLSRLVHSPPAQTAAAARTRGWPVEQDFVRPVPPAAHHSDAPHADSDAQLNGVGLSKLIDYVAFLEQ